MATRYINSEGKRIITSDGKRQLCCCTCDCRSDLYECVVDLSSLKAADASLADMPDSVTCHYWIGDLTAHYTTLWRKFHWVYKSGTASFEHWYVWVESGIDSTSPTNVKTTVTIKHTTITASGTHTLAGTEYLLSGATYPDYDGYLIDTSDGNHWNTFSGAWYLIPPYSPDVVSGAEKCHWVCATKTGVYKPSGGFKGDVTISQPASVPQYTTGTNKTYTGTASKALSGGDDPSGTISVTDGSTTANVTITSGPRAATGNCYNRWQTYKDDAGHWLTPAKTEVCKKAEASDDGWINSGLHSTVPSDIYYYFETLSTNSCYACGGKFGGETVDYKPCLPNANPPPPFPKVCSAHYTADWSTVTDSWTVTTPGSWTCVDSPCPTPASWTAIAGDIAHQEKYVCHDALICTDCDGMAAPAPIGAPTNLQYCIYRFVAGQVDTTLTVSLDSHYCGVSADVVYSTWTKVGGVFYKDIVDKTGFCGSCDTPPATPAAPSACWYRFKYDGFGNTTHDSVTCGTSCTYVDWTKVGAVWFKDVLGDVCTGTGDCTSWPADPTPPSVCWYQFYWDPDGILGGSPPDYVIPWTSGCGAGFYSTWTDISAEWGFTIWVLDVLGGECPTPDDCNTWPTTPAPPTP